MKDKTENAVMQIKEFQNNNENVNHWTKIKSCKNIIIKYQIG